MRWMAAALSRGVLPPDLVPSAAVTPAFDAMADCCSFWISFSVARTVSP